MSSIGLEEPRVTKEVVKGARGGTEGNKTGGSKRARVFEKGFGFKEMGEGRESGG